MEKIRTGIGLLLVTVFSLGLAACEPEVGSKEWCTQLDQRDKADWTANEASDYAKHCVL